MSPFKQILTPINLPYNMKIFKITIPFIAIAGLALIWGCEKYLEQAPVTEYAPATYYNSKQQAEQGLYGVYDMLQKEGTYYRYLWTIVDGISDDIDQGAGDSYGTMPFFLDNPSTPGHNNGWITHYQGITRANTLLAGLEKATAIAEVDKLRIEGETQFLRALFYFNLVNIYGGVPVVTIPLEPKEANVPRSSIEEVYAQIEKDLLNAINALPPNQAVTGAEKGRATKGAAQTLLARAYLFQGKYAQAAQLAKEVIDSQQYTLTPGAIGYRTNFLVKGENGPESIFEVQQSDASAGRGWAQEEGNHAANWNRPGAAGGWSGSFFNPSLAEQNPDKPLPLQGFEPDDPRRQYTMTVPGTSLPLDKTPDFVVTDAFSPTSPAKHWSDMNIGYIDVVNFIILRYAEVLLIRAEALIEQNQNLTEAQELINQVRNRVGLSSVTAATQTELRDIVRHERRVELAFELTRFWDLRRWNLLEPALTAAGKPYTPARRYAPIPQTQIDLSLGVLKQNEGY
jgi:hypothetical protein